MAVRIKYPGIRSALFFLGFIFVLAACAEKSPDSPPDSQFRTQGRGEKSNVVTSLTLADDTDVWGGGVGTLGTDKFLAVALHSLNKLSVWKIDSNRTVSELGGRHSTGYHPDGVSALGEGKIVVAVEGATEYSIWSLSGEEPRELLRSPTPFPSRDVVVADLDQDGFLDLILAPYIGDQLAVLWGDGKGYSSPQFISAGLSPWHPVVYDWNKDGVDDLIWSELDTGKIQLVLGDAKRELKTEFLYQVSGTTARHLAVGDVDGDGNADLAVAVEVGDSKILLAREGNEFEVLRIPPEEDHLGFVSAAILAGGVVAFADEKRVILLNYKDTSLAARKYLTAGSLPAPMKSDDLDRDGILDLVVFNSAGGGVTVHFGPVWENAVNEKIHH